MLKPKISIRRWRQVRFLIINGHVGQGLLNGVLRRALALWPRVDIILIQEGAHAPRWKKDAGEKFAWWPAPRTANQPMTYVLYRKDRFERVDVIEKNITHGGQYPRELDGVLLFDKLTNRTYSVSSFHVDPLGAGFDHANKHARANQMSQTHEYIEWHDDQPMDVLPFSGGDTNNWLPSEQSKGSVRQQFATIHMTPLFTHLKNPGEVKLEDLFARFGADVKAVQRIYRWFNVAGMDHGLIYGVVKVRKA